MTDPNAILASGYELSTQQKRIIQLSTSDLVAQPLVASVSYASAIAAEALREALDIWVQSHELLYARFVTAKGFKLPLIQIPDDQDASSNTAFVTREFDSEAALQAYLGQGDSPSVPSSDSVLAQQSLIDMPLLTLALLHTPSATNAWTVVFKVSPLCADSHSILALIDGVLSVYDGLTGADPDGFLEQFEAAPEDGEEDALQYLDVAETFAEMLQKSDPAQQAKHLAAYQSALNDKEPVAHLFLSQSLPTAKETGGRSVSHYLSLDLVEQCKRWSESKDVALRSVMWGLSRVLLSRIAPNDMALALNVSGREDGEITNVLGPVSRAIPAQIAFESSQNLYSLAAQIDMQFDELEQQAGSFDFSQVWSAQNMSQTLLLDYLDASQLNLSDKGVNWLCDAIEQHPLKLSFIAHKRTIQLVISYRPEAFAGCFDAQCAQLLVAKFEHILSEFIANPDGALVQFAGQSAAEFAVTQNTQSNAKVEHACVHDAFAYWATMTPDAIAIRDEEGTYTYRAINDQAHALAQGLLSVGFKQPHEIIQATDVCNKRVAICTHRNHHFVVAMLAVLKAGAVYVPIDPEFHSRRMQQILVDADCSLVIVENRTSEVIPAQLIPVFTLEQLHATAKEMADPTVGDSSKESGLKLAHDYLENCQVPSEQTAYLIYTSGSTGVPKGVCLSHKAITQYVANVMQRIGLNEKAALSSTPSSGRGEMLSISSLATDLGHTALFGALLTGRTVRLFEANKATDASALAQALSQHPVDCLKIVPAHLKALLTDDECAAILPRECLVLGGDKLSAELVHTVHQLRPDLRIINHYGPTETTVGATSFEVPTDAELAEGQVCPIGRPLGGNELQVLDDALNPVGVGQVGEIYLGGETLADGYRQQASQTAAVFVPKVGGASGERLYRTGDVGYFHADGELMFLARADNQVKIRGYRIELAEIEQAICAHDAVNQAKVCLQKVDGQNTGEDRLVAYLVMEKVFNAKMGQAMTQEVLKNHLVEFFPEYMIPSAFKTLKQIPLTQNGKVDYKSLPEIDFNAVRSSSFIAPATELEKEFAQQWTELLGIPEIGVKDSFFHLGGHSLLVTQFLSWLKRYKNIELSVKDFFDKPTICGLVALIKSTDASVSGGSQSLEEEGQTVSVDVAKIRQLRAAQEGETAQAPLSLGQERLWLIDQLEGASSDYNTPHIWCVEGEMDVQALNQAFMALTRQQHSLRTYFTMKREFPVQQLASDEQLKPLEVADFTDQYQGFDDALANGSALKAALMQDCGCLFALNQPPLYLFKLYQIDAQQQVLLLNMHHIISDGWSFGIIQNQLMEAYNRIVAGEQNVQLGELEYHYVDFALWQREMLKTDAWQKDIDFWDNQLRDVPEIAFPKVGKSADKGSDKKVDTFGHANGVAKVGSQSFWLPESLQTQLNEVYKTQSISPFMLCMAVYQVMLSLYTRQDDFAVGTSIAGRTDPAFDSIVGFFVNQLAFRVDMKGSPSVGHFLERVKASALEAYSHQDVPFSVLVSKLKGERNTERTPFFQCLYVFQEFPEINDQMTGLSLKPYNEFDYGAKFDLTLYMGFGQDGRLGGTWTYNTAYFDDELAQKLSRYFERVLTQFVTDTSVLISQITIKTDAEKEAEKAQKSAKRKSRFGRVEKEL